MTSTDQQGVGKTCPYLALEHDRASFALYPRPDHVCCRPGAPPPELSWQARHCLGGAWAKCPFAIGDAASGQVPVGTAKPASASGRQHGRVLLSALAFLVLLVVATVIVVRLSYPDRATVVPLPTIPPTTTSALPNTSAPVTPAAPVESPATVAATPAAAAPALRAAPQQTQGAPTAPATTTIPSVPATSQPPAPTPVTTYVVAPGDTLVSIAAAHGTSVNELVQLNHIDDPDIIPVGSTLQLP